MSKNPVHHRRTKHIELDIHFVRERVALGELCVVHVPTDQQFADVMTKGLPTATFRSSLTVGTSDAATVGGDNGGLQPSLQDAANGPRRSRAERAPAARSVRAQTESLRAERAHDLHEHDEWLSGLVFLYVGSERPRAVLAPV